MWDNKEPNLGGMFKFMMVLWALGVLTALSGAGVLIYIMWGFAKSQGWI